MGTVLAYGTLLPICADVSNSLRGKQGNPSSSHSCGTALAAMHENCFYLMTSFYLLPSTGEFDPPPVGAAATLPQQESTFAARGSLANCGKCGLFLQTYRDDNFGGPFADKQGLGSVPQLIVPRKTQPVLETNAMQATACLRSCCYQCTAEGTSDTSGQGRTGCDLLCSLSGI